MDQVNLRRSSPVPRCPSKGRAIRALDVLAASGLLLILLPIVVIVAVAIKLDSRGPVFFRARRVGRNGATFSMLKFRKMHANATGAPLTVVADARLTRVGFHLTRLKLDEIPQLWNVVKGEMSMVGPRPEDPRFVAIESGAYEAILSVPPGITGLAQLAFAKEASILDPLDRTGDYLRRVLPAKLALDQMYVERRSLRLNLRILYWTAVAVVVRRDVAVHRGSLKFNIRRRIARLTAVGPVVTSADELADRPSDTTAAAVG
jgi:lipopolysaccharide/colanic/teichoic acid biosynthesis glycosyltransferase